MPVKKTIIYKWRVIKKNLYSWIKDYLFQIDSKHNSTAFNARVRKKLVKIVLNWRNIWFHLMDKKNRTLFIDTEWKDENITIYTDL